MKLTPEIIGQALKKGVEKEIGRRLQTHMRLSELSTSQRILDGKCRALQPREALETPRAQAARALMGRRPEQLTSDVAARLLRTPPTQEMWAQADLPARVELLNQAAQVMAQEMLLPQAVRNGLQVCVDGTGVLQEGHIGLSQELLRADSRGPAYAEIYRQMGILHEEFPSARTEACADAQKNLFERMFLTAEQPLGKSADTNEVGADKAGNELTANWVERPDNLGNWGEIPTELTWKENLDQVNPNFELGDEWQYNCQRCVPTYEMRARGYDVTAKPRDFSNNYLSYHPFKAWKDADVSICGGDPMKEIQARMAQWGNGARAQIVVEWKGTSSGHTFIAEQRDGVTCFVDPQTGETDVSWYFDRVEPGSVRFCRTDQLQPSKHILDCCQEVQYD